jgi:hypothetical protein
MSQGNVEIVRRVYKLAEVRGVEGLLELATDDIVWISDPRFPGGGRHTGKENVRRWLAKIWIYDAVSVDVEEIIDLDDWALPGSTGSRRMPLRWTGRGAISSRSERD